MTPAHLSWYVQVFLEPAAKCGHNFRGERNAEEQCKQNSHEDLFYLIFFHRVPAKFLYPIIIEQFRQKNILRDFRRVPLTTDRSVARARVFLRHAVQTVDTISGVNSTTEE